MCSNVYDEVTYFEVCGFIKNTKNKYLKKDMLLFFQIKKITLYTDGYYQVLLDSGACMGQSFSRPGLKFFDSLTLWGQVP